jgi:hypothetical protein
MSQLTKNQKRRIMYVENKSTGEARIGWVTFSKTGKTVYYQNKTLKRLKGGGVSGNYFCEDTLDEYWVSGVKKRGSNAHWAEPVKVIIDDDAKEEYEKITNRTKIR